MAEVSLKIKKKDGTFLELDKSYLQSIESLTQLTSDPSSIQYGAIPNSGSATAVDIDGKIKKAIENGTIDNSNLQAEFWMNGNRISSHIITDSDYTTDKNYSLKLSNGLSFWDNLYYEGRDLSEPITAYNLLKEVLQSFSDKYTSTIIDSIILGQEMIYGDENSVGTVADYLKTLEIQYPVLDRDTYRNTINKFCVLAQLQCIFNTEDYPVFFSARPIFLKGKTDKFINVGLRNQKSQLVYPILLKNNYQKLSIAYKNVKQVRDIYTVIETKKSGWVSSSESDKDYNKTSTSGVIANTEVYAKFYTGVINVPKKTNRNLKINANLYSGVDDDEKALIKHTVKYIHSTGTAQAIMDESGTLAITPSYTSNIQGFGEVTNYKPIVSKYYNSKSSVPDITNLKVAEIKDMGDYYSVEVTVLVEKETLWADSGVTMTGRAEKYSVEELSVSIYGDTITYEFNDVKQTFGEGNVNFELQTNQLEQEPTQKNIIKDYRGGISNASAELFITNLYCKDGTLAKDWSKGQILADGDIVYFDNDTYSDGSQRYWRVTSVKPNYKGEPLFSIELMEVKPVSQGKWTTKTWSGLTDFYGYNVWTFDKNIYYSRTSETGMIRGHYHLTPKSNEWESVVWTNIMRSFTGKYIWHSSSHTYFSEGSNQYVLDNDTHKWAERLWSPDGITLITSLYGNNFWTHNGKTFYSSTYIIEPIEGGDRIREISWISPTSFTGEDVWTDGKNAYFSSGTTHYILDTDTLTATIKKWNGLTSFNGKYIWTDGRKVYYSHGEEQYVLNQDTSTWEVKTWNGLTSFNGDDIWEYMGEIYYSNGTEQYVLT